jgi:formimidoylglutamate deiminase
MGTIRAERALLPTGWARDVAVEVADGRIVAVMPDAPPGGERVALLLPAPANVHSHAFQRAMAGLTERRGPGRDSFWTWRSLMFRFLDHLTPSQVEAITALVQVEMLEAGYGASVEFHYLHHQPGGVPYDDVAEMAERIAAAAGATGIGLTLLPVHYQWGGLDRRPLGPGQARFGTTPDTFARLHEASRAKLRGLPDAVLGTAPHSLRAVSPEGLAAAAALGGPVHMHLAETVAEVEEVRAATGARPVEWLLDHADVGAWCLIHCTQMEPRETERLAATGAVAGLCPLTEASLGDGVFDGVRWLAAGGAVGIGSTPTSAWPSPRRSASSRPPSACATIRARRSPPRRGPRGAGSSRPCSRAAPKRRGARPGPSRLGLWADLLALDARHLDLDGLDGDTLLDAWLMAGDDRMVRDVWSAGRHVVRGGRHVARDAVERAYRAAVRPLRS